MYHHGTLPVDYLYLVADVYLKSGRLIHSIVDRTLLLVGMTLIALIDIKLYVIFGQDSWVG